MSCSVIRTSQHPSSDLIELPRALWTNQIPGLCASGHKNGWCKNKAAVALGSVRRAPGHLKGCPQLGCTISYHEHSVCHSRYTIYAESALAASTCRKMTRHWASPCHTT